MKEIELTKGFKAMVDDEDFEFLSQWKWHYSTHGYAMRNGKMIKRIKASKSSMHREIMKIVDRKIQVDHINGNRLDNRKINLRLCANAENTRNQNSRQGSTSQYKGVCWISRRKEWQAKIKVNYKGIHLGWFKDERKAAQAYNLAAVKYHGNFARINRIEFTLEEAFQLMEAA